MRLFGYVILTVRDNGTPPLAAYRRAIVRPVSTP